LKAALKGSRFFYAGVKGFNLQEVKIDSVFIYLVNYYYAAARIFF